MTSPVLRICLPTECFDDTTNITACQFLDFLQWLSLRYQWNMPILTALWNLWALPRTKVELEKDCLQTRRSYYASLMILLRVPKDWILRSPQKQWASPSHCSIFISLLPKIPTPKGHSRSCSWATQLIGEKRGPSLSERGWRAHHWDVPHGIMGILHLAENIKLQIFLLQCYFFTAGTLNIFLSRYNVPKWVFFSIDGIQTYKKTHLLIPLKYCSVLKVYHLSSIYKHINFSRLIWLYPIFKRKKTNTTLASL